MTEESIIFLKKDIVAITFSEEAFWTIISNRRAYYSNPDEDFSVIVNGNKQDLPSFLEECES